MDSSSITTPEAKASSASPRATGSRPNYKLSCTLCRSRKVKCDRLHPCSHCVRSGVDCVFPARKRMQRPRKTKNSELLNRISRLESIVGKVGIDGLKDVDMSDFKLPGLSPTSTPAQETPQSWPTAHEGNQVFGSTAAPKATQPHEGRGGREANSDSRYMSAEFWSNLCGEVEGLKQALAQSTDSDSDSDFDSTTPESIGMSKQQTFATQGLLAGYPSPESTGLIIHPSKTQIDFLATTFFENVDPLLKILHRPSILKMISEGTSKLSAAQEALQFSIYFSAVNSLDASTCISQLGQNQITLLKTYQLEVERALAAADYLNTNDLESLQALTLYVACLRVHNDTRASWVLTSMLIRLAQAHNLNRDGDGSRYTPFEAETRRRLWWQIVVLDIRASEDRGTEAMIPSDSYNTRLPSNLNDDDFNPASVGPLVDRTGPSDVTFSRCTAQSSAIFLWIGHAQARVSPPGPAQSEEEIIARAQSLESQFVANADPAHYQSALASGLVRLINLKLWLIMQYPLHPSPDTPFFSSSSSSSSSKPDPSQCGQNRRWGKVPREAMLQTAVSVMELHERKHTGVHAQRFGWWGATYVQWHPLAVALAELCVQTRGPLVQRAWDAVEIVYPKWSKTVADSKRGSLWRPIRKLYKKAKEARAGAIREEEEEEEARKEGERADAMGRLDLIAGDGIGAAMQTQSTGGPNRSNSGLGINSSGMSLGGFDSAAAAPALGDGQLTLEDPVLSPSVLLTDPSAAWPEVNFDMPLENTLDPMNWGIWNEFLDDTYAEFEI
ncbi:fungal-specific transcription factor domain-containing protein [Xylariales sp. AK1849]|nr:fungal-specific transcription factor domain-containing protein [Xylariales sp. AK1849]